MDQKEIDQYFSQRQIVDLFAKQLLKDFEGAGIAGVRLPDLLADPAAIRQSLQPVIERLEQSGEQLPRLLYRVDVSEGQLRNFSSAHPGRTFAEVATELIIRRVLQKVVLRKKWSNG